MGSLRVTHAGHGTLRDRRAPTCPTSSMNCPCWRRAPRSAASLDVTGAGELRVKESDRITALVRGLRALGVRADERPDGFVIDGSRGPTGGVADAAGDHRLVMAFALVGLGATGPTTVTGADAVAVSYPDFARDLARALRHDARQDLPGRIHGERQEHGRAGARGPAAAGARRTSTSSSNGASGMTIAEIFARQGEPYFRAVEREILHLLQPLRHVVVATGGGTFMDPDNRALHQLRRRVGLDRRAARRSDSAHSARRPAAARGQSRGARAALRRARRHVPAGARARAGRPRRRRRPPSTTCSRPFSQLPPILAARRRRIA